jgi:hypothetical protein
MLEHASKKKIIQKSPITWKVISAPTESEYLNYP